MAQAISIVVAYWHHYVTTNVRQDNIEGDRWFWAWEAVEELVRRDPDEALTLVVDLADACPSAQGLAYLGAGPVEDLVKTANDVVFGRILALPGGANAFGVRWRRSGSTTRSAYGS